MTAPPSTPTGDTINAVQIYRELSDTVFRLHAAHRLREALELLTVPPHELRPWRAELAHLRACLHGSLGEHDQALDVLVDAHAAGSWWDPRILVEDDDLSGLWHVPAFDLLVASSREQWQQANATTDRTGDRVALPDNAPRGLLVALHGAEEDADDAMEAWGRATLQGFAVLAVRSSQRTSPSYRSWPDPQRATLEVAEAHALLPGHVRALPTVAAGFSAGGRVALHWALTGDPLPVAGVVAVAPAASTDRLPSHAAQTPLRPALLVVGSQDELSGDVAAIGRELASHGFVVDVVPGLGHAFPDDFGTRLETALRRV